MAHDARTASAGVAGGAPGRPNATRRPVSSWTATIHVGRAGHAAPKRLSNGTAMSPVGTVPSGSSAAASEPGDTVHGARTAARKPGRRGERAGRRAAFGTRAQRAESGSPHDGRALRVTAAGAAPPHHVGGRHPGPQHRRHDRAGGRADDEVGAPGVPAELVAEGGQDSGVERVADRATRSEDERDAWHAASPRTRR